MVKDYTKNISIKYNLLGKVSDIYDLASNALKIKYAYNERGQKIRKTVYPDNENSYYRTTTHYFNDVQGNVLSIYTDTRLENTSPKVNLAEQTIYGMGRVGVIYTATSQTLYELTDHLGNVRATVSDNEVGVTAEVLSYTDYYPHGSVMPGRHYTSSTMYRYDYQGIEKDQETNWNNFELRMYDANLGRWMSPDPYGEFFSPYLAMGNNPVSMVDPDGGRSVRGEYVPKEPTINPYDGDRDIERRNAIAEGGSYGDRSVVFTYYTQYFGDGDGNRTGSMSSYDLGELTAVVQTVENINFHSTIGTYNLSPITITGGRMVNSNNAFNEVNFIMNNLDNINSKEWNTLTNNANIRIDNNSNMYFEDTRIFTSEVSNLKDGAAFTLPGIGIFVNPKDIGNLDLLRHEYGHILEYNRYGAADYLVIIISSMYSANYAYPHQKTWTESQANTLSYYYFNQPSNWNMNIYPIDKNYLKTIKK